MIIKIKKFMEIMFKRWISILLRPSEYIRIAKLYRRTKREVVSKGHPYVCDDLFIVTSCTNPSDMNDVINHNSEHDQWQRAKELLLTFESIRENYPFAIIINLENSNLNPELMSKIKENCDYHRDYSMDGMIIESRKFQNKGIPWAIKMIKFLQEEGGGIRAKRIHFLCGRYKLNNNILAKKFDPGAYFRYYSKYNNVSTRYIGYFQVPAREILDSLLHTLKQLTYRISIEERIHGKGKFRKHYLPYIGVSGMVNGRVLIEE